MEASGEFSTHWVLFLHGFATHWATILRFTTRRVAFFQSMSKFTTHWVADLLLSEFSPRRGKNCHSAVNNEVVRVDWTDFGRI